jgi:hypothetical protein
MLANLIGAAIVAIAPEGMKIKGALIAHLPARECF